MTRILLLITVFSVSFTTWAQTEPRALDIHRDWKSYVLDNPDGKVCYIASGPLESSPEIQDRAKNTWVTVTHWPSENVRNEVGVVAGYVYQTGTQVSVVIDTEKFELFTRDNGAWLETPEQEIAVVEAMKKGRRMTVVGYSSSGVTTTDKYSLLGFTAAHRAISKECGAN